MPTISDFAARFKGGVRPNLFRVSINGAPELFTDLEFLCKAATIPDSTIGKVEVGYRGRKLQVPGDRVFSDWEITVLNDTNWQNRSAMEAWLARIQAHTANYSDFDNNDIGYYGQAAVSQLDRQNNIIRTYRMEVMPTAVAAITLGSEENDSVEEFACTFAVNYYTIDSQAGDGATSGSGIDISVGGNIKIGPVQVGFNF
jgi:hypothetical protein